MHTALSRSSRNTENFRQHCRSRTQNFLKKSKKRSSEFSNAKSLISTFQESSSVWKNPINKFTTTTRHMISNWQLPWHLIEPYHTAHWSPTVLGWKYILNATTKLCSLCLSPLWIGITSIFTNIFLLDTGSTTFLVKNRSTIQTCCIQLLIQVESHYFSLKINNGDKESKYMVIVAICDWPYSDFF